MSVIHINILSLKGQNHLSRNRSALTTAIERLSSGLRVNSARDDAAGLAIGNRFQSQTTGLAQGMLDSINQKLHRIRELTVQAPLFFPVISSCSRLGCVIKLGYGFGVRMKRASLVPVLFAIALSGCKTGSVLPAANSQFGEPPRASSDSTGGVILSPGALIEQEHQDRLQRIRRFAEHYKIPPPSVDQQLILPASLFSTDRDIPVIRVAWGERSFFDTNRDIPRAESERVLSMLAEVMKNDLPDTHLLVVGHTDARGSETYNQDLSLRRAENVADRLLELGVRDHQVTYMGMGKLQPVATNLTADGMAVNRRVEFFLGAYPEVTTEAVGRVPVNPEHHRLPSDSIRERVVDVPEAGRSVNAYTAARKPSVPDIERELGEATSRQPEQPERKAQARQIAQEVTIGGRERTIDLPAVVYREPAIGSRRSGF